MTGDRFLAKLLRQAKGHALRQSPRVDEHQRTAMRSNERRELLIDLAPVLVGANGRQFKRGDFHAQIEIAGVAGVDDEGRVRLAYKKPSDFLNRLLCRRETDP